MTRPSAARRLLDARADLFDANEVPPIGAADQPAEGGCGVIGLACEEAVPARHLFEALTQMRNRGNGKGGGVAAVGLDPDQLGVSRKVLERDTLLTVAYLDPEARSTVEQENIDPAYRVDHVREVPTRDMEDVEGLETRPPDVVQYFVRPREDELETFAREHDLGDLDCGKLWDEFVYRTSFQLNLDHYSATGEARGFVLSHGKNMFVLKAVAYAEDVVRYYKLEDTLAYVWIGHHRYPTKGKVWHPGGAHPFVGLNEALVHNGDFANYRSTAEFLAQRNIRPLFLTDTEVSVLVFDLLHRVYEYPLEHTIETLAPTTERDFTLLPQHKQRIYEQLQTTHMHGSPDGPWFFLVGQSRPNRPTTDPAYRLLGITDTSMLRPQVFGLQANSDGPSIGLAASEKQGIDAALRSLSQEDERFLPRADRYWNARGGSHTDGGAFAFTVTPEDAGEANASLAVTDKFGDPINVPERPSRASRTSEIEEVEIDLDASSERVRERVLEELPSASISEVRAVLDRLVETAAASDPARQRALSTIAGLLDERRPTGGKRRARLRAVAHESLEELTDTVAQSPSKGFAHVGVSSSTPDPLGPKRTVFVDARGFPQEGEGSLARRLVDLARAGARHLVVHGARGHRFLGNGLGALPERVRVDVFGTPGDYLASGLDRAEIHVHGDGQDQIAQIMKGGRLVVHGDVGQTFMYGAEGGEAFVRGDAAGRPLINAVGSPRVVINGTCLDYLAESFMAGDPHDGGGFVVLNGLQIDDEGGLHELETPYPGGNLFSLASGGAIFLRDPRGRVGADQLNGGQIGSITREDWELIRPLLAKNESLLGVPVARLLTVDGRRRLPEEVYRKVQPGDVDVLQTEEAWVKAED